MFRFVIGFTSLFFAIVIFEMLGSQSRIVQMFPKLLWRWVLLVVIAPSFSVMAIAIMAHHLRPMRMFQPKATGTLGPMQFGLILGLIVAVLIPFALVWLVRWVDEAFIPALVTGVVSIPALTLVARRCVPGYCVRCGYDIRCSLDSNRCPECGAIPMGG